MSGKNITLDDKNIKKSNFYEKKQFNACDIDVDKILSSRKVPYTFLDIMMIMTFIHKASSNDWIC